MKKEMNDVLLDAVLAMRSAREHMQMYDLKDDADESVTACIVQLQQSENELRALLAEDYMTVKNVYISLNTAHPVKESIIVETLDGKFYTLNNDEPRPLRTDDLVPYYPGKEESLRRLIRHSDNIKTVDNYWFKFYGLKKAE